MRVLTERVMAGAAIKKPLVLDIGGQFPDSIHIDTIDHDGIRNDLRPASWKPAKYVSWNVSASEIAEKAFKRGHDALVLTNTADGKTHTIRANGHVGLAEGRLPSFSEYYLIEAVDLDRTWETHKDKIMKRVLEGKHNVELRERKLLGPGSSFTSIPTNGRPWDDAAEKEARRMIHHNVVNHYQYKAQTPQNLKQETADRMASQSHPLHVTTSYNDQHLAAATLRQAVANDGAAAEMKAKGVDTTHAQFAAEDHARAKQVFMDMVKEAAPHPKYIPTITKMYATGQIKRMEDIPTQAAEAFGQYHKLATHGRLDPDKHVAVDATKGLQVIKRSEFTPEAWKARNDKNYDTPVQETNFKAFSDLNDVRAVTQHPDHRDFFKTESKAALKGQYTVVHDDDDVTVYHPHTWEASKSLAVCPHSGKKASWCTATDSTFGKNNFEHYSKQGPLLIYHPKNPLHDGEMYQTHHASNQYMDEHDEEVDYHHHSTAKRTNDRGIVSAYVDEDGVEQSRRGAHPGFAEARFPGFNSKSALTYTYNHMYDHPEQYDRKAPTLYGEEHENVGISHVQHGTVMKHTMLNHINHTRNPANTTVKDHAAYDAAHAHHVKVLQHYNWDGDDEEHHHHDEEDEDEWR